MTGGKGEFGRARRVPFSPRSLRALIFPSPSPFNACHAGEIQGDCRVRLVWGPVKVARYSFSGSIPPKFEHKLRRHKERFGRIAATIVLDKDEHSL